MSDANDYDNATKRRRIDRNVLNSDLNGKNTSKLPVKFMNYFQENFNDNNLNEDEINLLDLIETTESESVVDPEFTKANNESSHSSQNNSNNKGSINDFRNSKDIDMVISSVVAQIMGNEMRFLNSFMNDVKKDSSLEKVEEKSFEFINSFSDPKNNKFNPKMKDVETLIHDDFVDIYKYFKENYDNFYNLMQEKYKTSDVRSFQRSVITSILRYYFTTKPELTAIPEDIISFVYDNVKEDPALVCCDLEWLNCRYYLEILYAMVNKKSFFRCMKYKDVIEDGIKIKFRKGYLNRLTEKLKKRYNYQDGAYSLFYMDGLDFPAFRKLPVKVKR